MKIPVTFFSYFKDLTETERTTIELPEESSLATLLALVREQYPKLNAMERSTLVAVGLEYQDGDYTLQPDDEVSLFPPVQGGLDPHSDRRA